MASAKAVHAALALLAMNFAGEVTDEKVRVWHGALADVSDDAVKAATLRLIRSHTGDFIPPVGRLRELAGANVAPELDIAATLRRIDRLGAYNPHTGWCSPRTVAVREVMGEAVARAYAAAGGERLFAGSETTRDIAARDFGHALTAAVKELGPASLEPVPVVPLLPAVAGVVTPLAEGMRAKLKVVYGEAS